MEEDASGMKRPRSREEDGPGEETPQPRKKAARPKTKSSAGTGSSGNKAGKPKAVPKTAPKAASKPASKAASKLALAEREHKKTAANDQLNFPEKLMQLINENMAPTHVTWIESEEAISFKTEKFQEAVLDKFFQGLKYDSFVRKLNRWGFRRVTSEGIAAGTVAYYHNSFRKDEQALLKTMGIGKKNDPEVQDLQAFGESSMIGSASAAISREAQSRGEASAVAASSAQTARNQLDRQFLEAAMHRQAALEHQITNNATAAARLPSPERHQETKTDVPNDVLPQAGLDSQQLLLEAMLLRQRETDSTAMQEREAASLVERLLLEQAQQAQRRASAAALTSLLANARDGDFVRQLAALAARQPQQPQPPPPPPPPQQPLQLSDLASNPALALLLQQHLQASNQGVNQNRMAGANPFAPNVNPLVNLAANVNVPQGLNLQPQGNVNPLASLLANANATSNTSNQGNQDLAGLLSLLLQNRQRDTQQREGE